MTLKVKMLPHLSQFADPGSESGIRRVIEAYFRYLPLYDVELTEPDSDEYDVLAVHAGASGSYAPNAPLVVHNHGLHWTADYECSGWQYKVNVDVIECIRHAKQVTVPSSWVAETFQRDMHFTPHIIHHGIAWDDWQHNEPDESYVIGYSKNRSGSDVSDPAAAEELARHRQDIKFINTFATNNAPSNITATGMVSHAQMKTMVQKCSVLVSTVKETGGILILEAMAAGKPVLGFAEGGILDWCEHGVNSYLVEPGSIEDLVEGLDYCLAHKDTLGANGREMARQFTWEKAAGKVAGVYRLVAEEKMPPMVIEPSLYMVEEKGERDAS